MKKAIIKKCKGRVKEIATSEFGHVFFMALFDCIDDTVLINKVSKTKMLYEAVHRDFTTTKLQLFD